MRACGLVATGLVVLCGAAPAAAAQQDSKREVSFGLLGGTSLPVSPSSWLLERAPHGRATIELQSPYPGLAFRLEGTYDSFRMPSLGLVSDESGQSLGMVTGSMRLLGGTANLVFRAPDRDDPVRMYLIGGVGVFRVQSRYKIPTEHGVLHHAWPARTRTGVNAGFGLEVPRKRVTAFADLRYHFVRGVFDRSALRMIPLSVGLRIH